MWVDESGGTDADASSTAGMTIHADGQDYSAEVNYDLDKDGVADTAIIENPDGTSQAFIDTNHDGVADQFARLDDDGKVIEEAVYDDSSGHWVTAGGSHGGDDDPGKQAGSGGHITADLPDKGEVDVGTATVDTNNDGVNDTAVVHTKDGGTIAFTDKDGDGDADVAVQVDSSGHSTTLEHTGKGQWTETSSGLMDDGDPASDEAWGGAGTETLEGVAKIDSGTGQWISPN